MKRPKFVSEKVVGKNYTTSIYYKVIKIGSVIGNVFRMYCSGKAPGGIWLREDFDPTMKCSNDRFYTTLAIVANTNIKSVKWIKNNSGFIYDYFPLAIKTV